MTTSGPAKAELSERVAVLLDRSRRFVLGDLIISVKPDDVVIPVDGVFDTPRLLERPAELAAGRRPTCSRRWQHRDLAIVVAARS